MSHLRWTVGALALLLGAAAPLGCGDETETDPDPSCTTGCVFTCGADQTCNFACPGGGCSLTCTGSAACALDCPGNGCSLTCRSGTDSCVLTGCATGCSVNCGGAADCQSSCDAQNGGCTVVP